jgi:hypothetical protein
MERSKCQKKGCSQGAKVLSHFQGRKDFLILKEMPTRTRWHKEKRVVEKGVFRLPADGKAWEHFDKKIGWFAADLLNINLGIATNGINLYRHMTSNYSMWSIFVILYNFPSWMCINSLNFMLPLLILGKISPGKDFHVFMQPPITDMMELWKECGHV